MKKKLGIMATVGLSAFALLSTTGCGGLECADGTVEQDGECVLAEGLEECEDDEVLKAGECVATGDLCEPGTFYDEDEGACVTHEDACGVNTEFVEGECIADDPIECGGDTELAADENECYQTEDVCDGETAFSAEEDRCVPTEDVCQDETYFDEDSGLCYPDIDCQAGDILVDGVCVSPERQQADEADAVAAGNTDPNFDGDPVDIELGDVGEETVFTGTIGEPEDIDGDGELDQKVDYFEFEADAGDWIEVSIASLGIPDPALKVELVDGDSDFVRYTAEGLADNNRQFIVPEDGWYHISVHPGAALDRQIGDDDWEYVGTVGAVEAEDAETHSFEDYNLEGELGALGDNFIAVDEIDEDPQLELTWEELPESADPVVQVWESAYEFSGEYAPDFSDRAMIEVPDTDEFYLVFDWTTKFGEIGHDYEVSGEATSDLDPGDSITVPFSADDGDGVEATWETTTEGDFWNPTEVDITIYDGDGDVVTQEWNVSDEERVTYGGLWEDDYEVEFSNRQSITFEDFEAEVEVYSGEEVDDFTAYQHDLAVIEQSNDDDHDATLAVIHEDTDEIVESGEISTDGSLEFLIGEYDGEFEVLHYDFDDTEGLDVTSEAHEPEEAETFYASTASLVSIDQDNDDGDSVALSVIHDDTDELVAFDTIGTLATQTIDFEVGADDGDFTVNQYDADDIEGLEVTVDIVETVEFGDFEVTAAEEQDVTVVSHDHDGQDLDIVVLNDYDEVIRSGEFGSDDYGMSLAALEAGDYSVVHRNDDGPDADEVEVDVWFDEPEEITDFDDTYSGTSDEYLFAEQDHYLVELDETTTYEITLEHDGGWWGRVFVYGKNHDQLKRMDDYISSTNPSETIQFEFEADTTYILRVGNEAGSNYSFDYTLSFD